MSIAAFQIKQRCVGGKVGVCKFFIRAQTSSYSSQQYCPQESAATEVRKIRINFLSCDIVEFLLFNSNDIVLQLEGGVGQNRPKNCSHS